MKGHFVSLYKALLSPVIVSHSEKKLFILFSHYLSHLLVLPLFLSFFLAMYIKRWIYFSSKFAFYIIFFTIRYQYEFVLKVIS